MKIKKVEIEGFRAYKLKEDGTFDFMINDEKPSNFIAIYAPNGFGKSSFYDAIEWGFTANLERYVREQNRKNNELAARGTKKSGIAQRIIRNKEVTDNIPTRVQIDTTRDIYGRTLGKIRADSRDLKFKEDETVEGTECYRSIILSQDGIDRFLREVKPQERYNLFMEYFGGETEKIRQELTYLHNDNNTILENLKADRIEIEKKLNEPIDETVISVFNSLILELNNEGESLPLVKDDFSDSTEHEIVSVIISRIHELKSIGESYINNDVFLSNQLTKLQDINKQVSLIREYKLNLEKLENAEKDAKQYQIYFNSLNKIKIEFEENNKKLDEILRLGCSVDLYIKENIELKEEESFIIELNNKKSYLKNKLEVCNYYLTEKEDSVRDINNKILNVNGLLDESSLIYTNINNHQSYLKRIESDIFLKKNTLDIDLVEINKIKSEINNLINIKIDLDTLVYHDISILNIDENIILDYQEIYNSLKNVEIQTQAIQKNHEVLTYQQTIIKDLASLGLQYVSSWPTDNCPLCNSKHPSPEKLKSIINNNELITDVIKDNAYALECMSKNKKILEEKLEEILLETTSQKNNRLAKLQLNLNEVSAKKKQTEYELSILESQMNTYKENIQNLYLKVDNLEKKEFEKKSKDEINQLSIIKNNHLTDIENLKNNIEKIKKNIFDIETKLKISLLKIDETKSKEFFREILKYIQENSIDSDSLLNFYESENNLYISKKEELFDRINQINSTCDILREKMIKNETWIEFDLIFKQKEEISTHLSDLEKNVKSFYNLIYKTTGKLFDFESENVDSFLFNEVDVLRSNYLIVKNKIRKFEHLLEQKDALKPYLISKKLKRDLIIVEDKISKHMLVSSILTDQLNIIFEKLRNRISTFFYTDLINAIYSKIDPHPFFKKVEFIPDFTEMDRPGLNIVIKDECGDIISPNLYFSAAQLNILSLSVFLARALHARDKENNPLSVILIDDPIQSMDSINVLSMIDLLRNISVNFDKQIIISTHDENFFRLLQRKVPTEIFDSKFIRLESFGVVAK